MANERILLIEDEKLIRMSLAEELTRQGFSAHHHPLDPGTIPDAWLLQEDLEHGGDEVEGRHPLGRDQARQDEKRDAATPGRVG